MDMPGQGLQKAACRSSGQLPPTSDCSGLRVLSSALSFDSKHSIAVFLSEMGAVKN